MNGNIKSLKSLDLIDKSLLALEALLGERAKLSFKRTEGIKDNGWDGILSINSEDFYVEAVLGENTLQKRLENKEYHIRKCNHALVKSSTDYILVVEYLDEDLKNLIKKEKLNYIDASGNCFIQGENFVFFVEGKPKTTNENEELKKAFRADGLIFVYFLLTTNLSVVLLENLYEQTDFKPHLIREILGELEEEGFVNIDQKGRIVLKNIKKLIAKWANNYAERLRPVIHRGYFKTMDKFETVKNNLAHEENNGHKKLDISIGGELAAEFMGHLKATSAIFYTNERVSDLVKKYRIFPSNSKDANIEIIQQFWTKELPNINLNSLVYSILVYADLLLSNDPRCYQVAETLLNNEIRNSFKEYRLQW